MSVARFEPPGAPRDPAVGTIDATIKAMSADDRSPRPVPPPLPVPEAKAGPPPLPQTPPPLPVSGGRPVPPPLPNQPRAPRPPADSRPDVARALAGGRERRVHPRFRLAVVVNFGSTHNFYSGRTRDISAGGLFIETDVPLPVGTRITVDLQLLKTKVRADSEVVWVLMDDNGQTVGMGVRFVSLPAAVRERIETFMGLRQAMLFEMEPDDDPAG